MPAYAGICACSRSELCGAAASPDHLHVGLRGGFFVVENAKSRAAAAIAAAVTRSCLRRTIAIPSLRSLRACEASFAAQPQAPFISGNAVSV